MKDQRVKNIVKYVVPTILSDVCFFLFTIVDGIFVGRSVGTNGLGAINLVAPYILIIGAISMLINIGGVTICAIRIGKGDVNGANAVFRQGLVVLCGVISVLSGRSEGSQPLKLWGEKRKRHMRSSSTSCGA